MVTGEAGVNEPPDGCRAQADRQGAGGIDRLPYWSSKSTVIGLEATPAVMVCDGWRRQACWPAAGTHGFLLRGRGQTVGRRRERGLSRLGVRVGEARRFRPGRNAHRRSGANVPVVDAEVKSTVKAAVGIDQVAVRILQLDRDRAGGDCPP